MSKKEEIAEQLRNALTGYIGTNNQVNQEFVQKLFESTLDALVFGQCIETFQVAPQPIEPESDDIKAIRQVMEEPDTCPEIRFNVNIKPKAPISLINIEYTVEDKDG
jgi:hypothetical protein